GAKSKVYFERSAEGVTTTSEALRSVAEKTKRNSLILYTAMQNNLAVPTEVFTWFSEDLVFVGRYEDSVAVSELVGLAKDDTVKARLLAFLHFADFNIIDLEVVEQSIPTLSYGHAS